MCKKNHSISIDEEIEQTYHEIGVSLLKELIPKIEVDFDGNKYATVNVSFWVDQTFTAEGYCPYFGAHLYFRIVKGICGNNELDTETEDRLEALGYIYHLFNDVGASAIPSTLLIPNPDDEK